MRAVSYFTREGQARKPLALVLILDYPTPPPNRLNPPREPGLSKIIGNLTARYSLGFTLAESEKDDGRLHNLEVRVKAPDAKGKLRRLEVSSRRGYYMSEMGEKEKEATAAKAQ
jgi:hypothetical protein